jgi:hypothetical protein
MTFNELHDGISHGCNCLDQEGVSENTEDFFARAVEQNVPSMDDFKSYLENGQRPKRPIKGCRTECMWRGVSVNKLGGNVPDIKAKWQTAKLFAPQGTKNFVCTFRLKVGAGKMWDTSNKQPDAHHSLLKADGFSLASVEIKAIVPIADF